MSTMKKYRQTAADLDNCYEQADPETIGEQISGWLLLIVLVAALVWLLLEWWS